MNSRGITFLFDNFVMRANFFTDTVIVAFKHVGDVMKIKMVSDKNMQNPKRGKRAPQILITPFFV